MRSALFRLRASNRVQHQLTRLRKLRNRWVDQPLQQLEAARRELVAGPVDVLVLGDSSTLSWSVRDADRTLLPEMLGREIGGKVVTIAGPGYGAHIYADVLRILATLDQRPKALVVAMALRTNAGTHILKHPTGGYPRSQHALAKVTSARHKVRSFGRGGAVTSDKADAAYRALPVHSRWAGWVTMDHYRKQLEGQGAPPWPVHLEKLRFDYFYGEYVSSDDPMLEKVSELGRRIDEYGVPTVAYWTQPPLQRGEMHFPGEFEEHVRSNLAMVEAALVKDSTRVGALLDIALEEDDLQDGQNGNEHYSYTGRAKYAAAIAAELRQKTERSQ